jgi:hypothetical protein
MIAAVRSADSLSLGSRHHGRHPGARDRRRSRRGWRLPIIMSEAFAWTLTPGRSARPPHHPRRRIRSGRVINHCVIDRLTKDQLERSSGFPPIGFIFVTRAIAFSLQQARETAADAGGKPAETFAMPGPRACPGPSRCSMISEAGERTRMNSGSTAWASSS